MIPRKVNDEAGAMPLAMPMMRVDPTHPAKTFQLLTCGLHVSRIDSKRLGDP
jgi:hypothetical protein